MSFLWNKKQWDPRDLHIYITGGSSGLGLELALLLAGLGAHISIVARRQDQLDKALKDIEGARENQNQIFKAYSFDLTSAAHSESALEVVSSAHGGKSPDAVFTCAGASKPMFAVEMTTEDITRGMDLGYWVQAWTVFAVARQMAAQKRTGKIIMVSSTVGYIGFVGYASYAPAKHALRGLADVLEHELKLYNIDVHIFFPTTMLTPGYEEENLTKPAITKKIESADEGLTAVQAAIGLLKGVQRGDVHITADFITSLFRASTRGSAPRSNWFLDSIYGSIAFVATPVWRSSINKMIREHAQEHQQYLVKQGSLKET